MGISTRDEHCFVLGSNSDQKGKIPILDYSNMANVGFFSSFSGVFLWGCNVALKMDAKHYTHTGAAVLQLLVCWPCSSRVIGWILCSSSLKPTSRLHDVVVSGTLNSKYHHTHSYSLWRGKIGWGTMEAVPANLVTSKVDCLYSFLCV